MISRSRTILCIAIIGAGSIAFAVDTTDPPFCHIMGVQQPQALLPEQVNPKLHGKTPTQFWAAEHVVNELGSDMIKIALDEKHLKRQGFEVGKNPSLTELATHPVYEKTLALPYRLAFFWAHGSIQFKYFTPRKEKLVYREFYDFTKHLLTKHNGSGKTFMIGNWEGDWLLGAKEAGDGNCTEENIQKMISWMNIRGKAIDDVKKAVPHENVQVYFYMEINQVRKARVDGLKRMVNSVLPHTKYTDYVSISSYEIQGLNVWANPKDADSLRPELFKDLDYVQSKLPPRSIQGKRVGIGEIGYTLVHIRSRYGVDEETAETIQARLALENAQVNLEWGVPFWLWWALHNNEPDGNGGYLGFGLIDQDSAKKRRLWREMKDYNDWAKAFIKKEQWRTKQDTSPEIFRKAAVRWLEARVKKLRREAGDDGELPAKPWKKKKR
ncbi:MAG: hypothetical protein K9M45_03245 [Kiritimatiellales bacterium]|nr:hypothetical protein [Kiritimatiellales bacterium]